MKYYFLSTSVDEKEIGTYFQTEGLPEGYTSKWYDEPDSMTKLVRDSLPDFIPDLKWELKPKAKLTDIISVGNITATGFLMNEKAKAIFQSFNLIDHKFHNATLFVKSQPLHYYYLQLTNGNFENIDIEKSSFCITNAFRLKKNDIIITSYNDLIEKQKKLEFGNIISAEKIHIKNTDFDLFFFPFIHNDIFVSEKLLNELRKYKITGYRVKGQDILQVD